MTKEIFVSTSFAGFHHWPQAPAVVGFLRNLHRHKFNVRVQFKVSGSDRELEFFMMQAQVIQIIQDIVRPAMAQNKSFSCEMIGELLIAELQKLKLPVSQATVDEDGENGAIITV